MNRLITRFRAWWWLRRELNPRGTEYCGKTPWYRRDQPYGEAPVIWRKRLGRR
jgi:hypothetical protein